MLLFEPDEEVLLKTEAFTVGPVEIIVFGKRLKLNYRALGWCLLTNGQLLGMGNNSTHLVSEVS